MQKPRVAVIKTIVSSVLYVGIFSGILVCLHNVFLNTDNDLTSDDHICMDGAELMEYDWNSSSFVQRNYSMAECMDRFYYQHTLLYRHSFSSQMSLIASGAFTVSSLFFLIFTTLVTCNRSCGGWQELGGDADYQEGKKGSCESALFCCGATKGLDGRPKFAWARRAAFMTLAGAALISLNVSFALVLLAFSKEERFVPQMGDESREAVSDEVDSDIRRVDNFKALVTLHVIAIVLKVAWILAVDDDQKTTQLVEIVDRKTTPSAPSMPLQTIESEDEEEEEEERELMLPTKHRSFNRNGYKSNRSYIRRQLNY